MTTYDPDDDACGGCGADAGVECAPDCRSHALRAEREAREREANESS